MDAPSAISALRESGACALMKANDAASSFVHVEKDTEVEAELDSLERRLALLQSQRIKAAASRKEFLQEVFLFEEGHAQRDVWGRPTIRRGMDSAKRDGIGPLVTLPTHLRNKPRRRSSLEMPRTTGPLSDIAFPHPLFYPYAENGPSSSSAAFPLAFGNTVQLQTLPQQQRKRTFEDIPCGRSSFSGPAQGRSESLALSAPRSASSVALTEHAQTPSHGLVSLDMLPHTAVFPSASTFPFNPHNSHQPSLTLLRPDHPLRARRSSYSGPPPSPLCLPNGFQRQPAGFATSAGAFQAMSCVSSPSPKPVATAGSPCGRSWSQSRRSRRVSFDIDRLSAEYYGSKPRASCEGIQEHSRRSLDQARLMTANPLHKDNANGGLEVRGKARSEAWGPRKAASQLTTDDSSSDDGWEQSTSTVVRVSNEPCNVAGFGMPRTCYPLSECQKKENSQALSNLNDLRPTKVAKENSEQLSPMGLHGTVCLAHQDLRRMALGHAQPTSHRAGTTTDDAETSDASNDSDFLYNTQEIQRTHSRCVF